MTEKKIVLRGRSRVYGKTLYYQTDGTWHGNRKTASRFNPWTFPEFERFVMGPFAKGIWDIVVETEEA